MVLLQSFLDYTSPMKSFQILGFNLQNMMGDWDGGEGLGWGRGVKTTFVKLLYPPK